MVSVMSFWAAQRTTQALTMLDQTAERTNPVTVTRNELIQAMGYGGMIHSFKNYVLRADEKYHDAATRQAGAALATLEQLHRIDTAHSAQLDAVSQTISAYLQALTQVHALHATGASPEEIDAKVKINDAPALEAIDLLNAQSAAQQGALVKVQILAELRDQIGYGGMIHNFKNLVLRQDMPRVDKVRANIARANDAMTQLDSLTLSSLEQEALRDLRSVIATYSTALAQTAQLITRGEDARAIDAAVKVSDAPALQALANFDMALADEGRAMAAAITHELEATRLKSMIMGVVVVLSSALVALGTGAVLKRGVVSKQEEADAAAQALTREREDFQTRMGALTQAASDGDYSLRIAQDYSDPTLLRAADQLDTLLDTIETGLNAVTRVSHAMADGDLTVRMEGDFKGAFGTLQITLNEAVHSIGALISGVLRSTDAIAEYTANIAQNADELAQRTETQSAALVQSASSIHELTHSVSGISTHVTQARGTASAANDVAQQGATVVGEAVDAMNRIVEASGRISRVTELIEDIAFQTNLLALNAGVEATRAGASGRGFAVVASEVQALAHRSSDAVRDINDLISASEAQIEDGVNRIAQAGTSIREISGYVENLDQSIAVVSASTSEQSSNLSQVNDAVSQLEGVTQRNAAMFGETAEAIQSLNTLTNSLIEAGARFVVDKDVTEIELFDLPDTKSA
jgi:methyl-accepting chemotaxis protein